MFCLKTIKFLKISIRIKLYVLNSFSLTSLEEYPRDALCQSETPRSDVADALENRSDVILDLFQLFEYYFVWIDFEITF
jgi:hypothetical protein